MRRMRKRLLAGPIRPNGTGDWGLGTRPGGHYGRGRLLALMASQPSPQSLVPLRKNLLEQRNRSRIIRLTQPEHGVAPNLRVAMGLRHANEDGNALVLRPLREREHHLLLHLAVDARIVRQRIETGRRRVAGSLAEPEHRLLSRFARAVV